MSRVESAESKFLKASAFLAGITLVAFLYLFGESVKQETQIIIFFNNFRKFTFAAVGLVLGYNFGDVYKQGASDLKWLYVGAFLTAAGILLYIHRGATYQSVPYNPPVPSMILVAAMAAGFLQISPIPSNYPQIGSISRLLFDLAPKVYLTAFLSIKYGLSFAVTIIERTPYQSEGLEAIAIVYAIIVVTGVASAHLMLRFSSAIQTS